MKQHCRYTAHTQTAIIFSMGLLLTFLLHGCGSLPPNLVSSNAVSVERINSSRARIGSLYVGDSNGRLKVRGRLKKRHAGRSPIPGHLHIAVLATEGAVLEEGIVRYDRHNPRSGASYFSEEFDVQSDAVDTVRVVHHVLDSQ